MLAEQGLFEGTLCGERMFCPGEPVTRSTVAVWLIRALGDAASAVSVSRFDDVDADEWWAGHVERLAQLEVAAGCGTDPLSYCPDDPLTRAELASWLVRAFDLPEASSCGVLRRRRATPRRPTSPRSPPPESPSAASGTR